MIILSQDQQTFLVRGDDDEGLLVRELAEAIDKMPNGWVVYSIDREEGPEGDVWAIRIHEKALKAVVDTDDTTDQAAQRKAAL